MDVENTVEWKTPRFVRVEQLFPLAQSNAAIHYGVPFGASSPENLMPNTGPRASDEIKPDSWRNSRLIHDWIHAGSAEWGLTLAGQGSGSDRRSRRSSSELLPATQIGPQV